MNEIDVFKRRFEKSWNDNPLMPAKDRKRMALEAGIGESAVLKEAWRQVRQTQPGREGLTNDSEALKLGRQMAGFMGRVARTTKEAHERVVFSKRQAMKEKRNNGNHKAASAPAKGRVVGDLMIMLRRAAQTGMTPDAVWWSAVLGIETEKAEELAWKLMQEGWYFEKFGLPFCAIFKTHMDPRKAEIANIERKIQELRTQLEGLKNG